MALSAATYTVLGALARVSGVKRFFPAAASVNIFEGAALGAAAGYLRPLVSGDDFAGFASHDADNSAGAAGALRIGAIEQGEATLTVVGSSAVTDQGRTVFATDDGTFTLTAGGSPIGEVKEWVSGTTCYVTFFSRLAVPSTANRDLNAVEARTTGKTVTTAESGKRFTNAGAGAAVTFAMPAAVQGLEYWFHVEAAQELRIDPNGTETIALPSSGAQGAAGKYLSADAVGEWVHIECVVTGKWAVMGYAGTWTAEA